MTERDEYSLVNAERLRDRRKSQRQSSPDSDPAELKKQRLDHRFDAVHNRVDTVSDRVDVLSEKIDTVIATQTETTLTVAQGNASIKAYGAALGLFITFVTIAANLLSKLIH